MWVSRVVAVVVLIYCTVQVCYMLGGEYACRESGDMLRISDMLGQIGRRHINLTKSCWPKCQQGT